MPDLPKKYRINYLFCKQLHHHEERVNLVCLSQECQTNSLICSLCNEDRHKGHKTKPLKHFLEGLQKQYSSLKDRTVNDQLEQLQAGRVFFLGQIREAVECLAEKFMELEQEVVHKYELIKSQILQREAKRKRFTQFYESMAVKGKGDPTFEIQNYLFFDPGQALNIDGQLSKFAETAKNSLSLIKNNILMNRKKKAFQESVKSTIEINLPNNNQFVFPKSIKCNANVFTQTDPNTKATLGYLSTHLAGLVSKLRIKLVSLPANCKFTIGVAKRFQVLAANGLYPLKNMADVFYLDSTGASQKQQYNYITGLKTGDIITAVVKKKNLKISVNGQMCVHHLYNKEETVLFFSMEGVCEAEMVYPYFK